MGIHEAGHAYGELWEIAGETPSTIDTGDTVTILAVYFVAERICEE